MNLQAGTRLALAKSHIRSKRKHGPDLVTKAQNGALRVNRMHAQILVGIYRTLRDWFQGGRAHERTLECIGALHARHVAEKYAIRSLRDVEFRVFSQWGDDGIIQWLVARLPDLPRRFVEFGVADYLESNTRFLMLNNNWSGLVMDGSAQNIARLRRQPWFWRHDLNAERHFATRENIDAKIAQSSGGEVGLLHIDVDGNDYWLWQAICCISPAIVIMEYNGLFGAERAITVPYRSDFERFAAHSSGQYFGASLAALTRLAHEKGYALIGSNSAGNNAYYLRREFLSEIIREVKVTEAYQEPRFSDSRNARGRLDHARFEQRQEMIRGLPVHNLSTNQAEPF